MQAVETVKENLKPRFEALIEYLGESDQPLAAAFFMQLLITLVALHEEEELLSLFLELSTTAFVGLTFDAKASEMIDQLLEEAQQVAQTFAVGDSNVQ